MLVEERVTYVRTLQPGHGAARQRLSLLITLHTSSFLRPIPSGSGWLSKKKREWWGWGLGGDRGGGGLGKVKQMVGLKR